MALLACNDFEVDEMNMDWMRPAPTMILESPELNSTSRWLGEDAIVDIIEGDAVDCPLTVPVRETVSHRQADGEGGPHFCSKLKMWSGLNKSLGGIRGRGLYAAGKGLLLELSVTFVPTLNFITWLVELYGGSA